MSERESSDNDMFVMVVDEHSDHHADEVNQSDPEQPERRKRRMDDGISSDPDDLPPEVKRSKQGMWNSESFNNLLDQMSFLTNFYMNNLNNVPPSNTNAPLTAASANTLNSNMHMPGTIKAPQSDSAPFLQRPVTLIENNQKLDLGNLSTLLKDPKMASSDPSRVKRLEELQKFNDVNWKEVRYAEALKSYCAQPGFIELNVNDELRQFSKGKHFIVPVERSYAALSNALLSQQECLKQQLQEFVDWAASPTADLTASNIFDKISELFNTKSKFHKTSEDIMQIVCGKRAECIESRRERILAEIPNKLLREGLRKIPPSVECLFDTTALASYIQRTGGVDKWIRPWFTSDKEHRKTVVPKQNPKPGPSRDSNNQSFRPNQRSKGTKPEIAPSGAKTNTTQRFRNFNRKEGGQSNEKSKSK